MVEASSASSYRRADGGPLPLLFYAHFDPLCLSMTRVPPYESEYKSVLTLSLDTNVQEKVTRGEATNTGTDLLKQLGKYER